MAMLTARNLPDDVHRALQVLATQDGVALSVAASRRSPQGGGQPRS
jgi:plasmid stability protein